MNGAFQYLPTVKLLQSLEPQGSASQPEEVYRWSWSDPGETIGRLRCFWSWFGTSLAFTQPTHDLTLLLSPLQSQTQFHTISALSLFSLFLSVGLPVGLSVCLSVSTLRDPRTTSWLHTDQNHSSWKHTASPMASSVSALSRRER